MRRFLNFGADVRKNRVGKTLMRGSSCVGLRGFQCGVYSGGKAGPGNQGVTNPMRIA